MTDTAQQQIERQRVMKVLAHTDADLLEEKYNSFANKPDWQFARKPETGLVMARGRIGGGGAPFNLGEISVTRAAVTLDTGEIGHAYCHGRNQRKAAISAFFDAAWQNPALKPQVENDIIAPCAQLLDDKTTKSKQEAAATKVDFFTLVRGDD
ncbi:phosphonate C-P lyase system protein PhnG [Maritalea sp.]|uniref:phosphonate C-P lyase system protein PhnG n=1 Tax=Maritalea sp. TaxID=2003361 RepID=UPI003EF259ED